jgi:hypothetical protein
VKEMDVEKILDKCRERRGLPKELRHRTFREFGLFMADMVDYLVFGLESEDKDIRKFQKKINREKWDAEDFKTYVKLFEKFWLEEV